MNTFKNSLFLFLSIVLLIASGCSDETDETVTTEGENEGEQTSENSVLNVAIDAPPPTLDHVTSTSASTRDASRLMFESLVTTDENFEPIPMLAESIDVSDDNKVYTFHLRQGIKFHNGEEMVAEDVIASMERWYELTDLSGQIFDGASWEEEDEYTVVLTLTSASPITLDTIATHKHAPVIMPKEIVESAPPEGVTEYIGTGPYQLVEWREDQYIHFTKNDDYEPLEIEATGLGGKKEALTEEVYIHLVPDSSTRLNGLQTGEYDFAYGIPLDNYDQIENTDGLDPILVPGSNKLIKFNNVEGIMADFEMREIVNTALDYDAIMKAVFADEEFYTLDSNYMQEGLPAWTSQEGSEYHNINDPEKAKQMLEDYGYNGEEVVINATRDFEFMYNMGVVVNEQLQEIGINSSIGVYDYASSVDIASRTDLWDIRVQAATMVTTPPQLITVSDAWSGGVNDPKITEDIEAIENASSIEEAYEIWDELQLYVWEEHLPIINFGNSESFYGINENVQGIEVSTLGPTFWNATVSE